MSGNLFGRMNKECEQANSKKNKKLEDYEPGATQAQVFKALKKVAKTPKPSDKSS